MDNPNGICLLTLSADLTGALAIGSDIKITHELRGQTDSKANFNLAIDDGGINGITALSIDTEAYLKSVIAKSKADQSKFTRARASGANPCVQTTGLGTITSDAFDSRHTLGGLKLNNRINQEQRIALRQKFSEFMLLKHGWHLLRFRFALWQSSRHHACTTPSQSLFLARPTQGSRTAP